MNRFTRVARMVVALAASQACASTMLGPSKNPATVKFQIGVTKKSDVANTLGLPAVRKIAAGHEYWGYSDHPQLLSLDIVQSNGHTLPIPIEDQLQTAYVYVFDAAGTLVSARRSE